MLLQLRGCVFCQPRALIAFITARVHVPRPPWAPHLGAMGSVSLSAQRALSVLFHRWVELTSMLTSVVLCGWQGGQGEEVRWLVND